MDPSPAPADPLADVPDELDAVAERPLVEHAEVFTRVHSALTSALATTAVDGPPGTTSASGSARPSSSPAGAGR